MKRSGGSRVRASAMLTALFVSPALAGDVVAQPGGGDDFVIEDSTGSERLRVDEATGNVSEDGTLILHSPGTNLLGLVPLAALVMAASAVALQRRGAAG